MSNKESPENMRRPSMEKQAGREENEPMIIDSASRPLQKLQAEEKHLRKMEDIRINQLEDDQVDTMDNSRTLVIMQKMNEKLAEYEQVIEGLE